ncbi:MAG: DUF4194 domain-containing protein [Planctomycetaceae bacterium]|nr:DUF4194 domain-containing protein [Planctomycetales bacterium]MCB9938671.1 DUF4194 domain-containing protein [Planctomycetaceae bacterium]
MNDDNFNLPPFREWSIPAVRLLQGVVYSDDTLAWNALLDSQTPLTEYFARIGLVLVVDESDGMAFIRQMADDERDADYQRIPKLLRRTPLGYDQTLLCVLLRDEYRRFEDEDLDNQLCVVETQALLDAWKNFFPIDDDEVKLLKRLSAAMNKLADMKFVRKFQDEPEAWEVRRFLKARVSIDQLEGLKHQLELAVQEQGVDTPSRKT